MPNSASVLFVGLISLAVSPQLAAQSDSPGGSAVGERFASAPKWTRSTAWEVYPEAEVRIGRLGSAVEFGAVAGVDRFEDGRIIVADRLANRVFIFSAEGDEQQVFGREGQGPGEFQRIGSVQALANDTVGVFDQSLGRFSKFSPDGTLLAETSVRVGNLPGVGTVVQRPGGDFLLTGAVLAGPGDPGFADLEYPILSFDPATDQHRELVREKGQQIYRSAAGFAQRVPVSRSRSTAVGRHLFSGNGERWEIRVYDFDGVLRELWGRTDVDLALEEAEFRAVTDRLVEAMTDENAQRLWRRTYSEQPAPEATPAYDKLLPDGAGVWARSYQFPSSSASETWAVFNGVGELEGDLPLPEGFELLTIDGDILLGIERDAFDVESVVAYRLMRAGA